MRLFKILFALTLVVAGFGVGSVYSDTWTIQPTGDTFISSSVLTEKGNNYGKDTLIRLTSSISTRKGLARFNLAGVPGAVSSIVLRVRISSYNSAGTLAVWAIRNGDYAWVEGTNSGQICNDTGSTWNYKQASPSVAWAGCAGGGGMTNASLDYYPASLGSNYISGTGVYSINLSTNYYEIWRTNGLMLGISAGGAGGFSIDSREAAVETNRPTLILATNVVAEGDTTPPQISAVNAPSSTLVQVVFDEAVSQSTATNPANYWITNGNAVTEAFIGVDPKAVALSVSAMTTGILYTLYVSNVTDLADNPIAANSWSNFYCDEAANEAPTADISEPPAWYEYIQHENISFIGSGNDSDGVVTSLVWQSSIDGNFGSGTNLVYNGLGAGTQIVYLVAYDNDGATGTSSSVSFNVLSDTNADQLPDDWAVLYWPDGESGGGANDSDLDGLSNYEEWLGGSDPTNSTSRLIISGSVSALANGFLIEWAGRPNRFYTVYWSTNLDSANEVLYSNLSCQSATQLSVTDTAHDVESGVYYRLRVNR